MTESRWLTSIDPSEMLDFLQCRGTFSVRKATLLMAGACRQVTGLLDNEGSVLAVESAERVVDGGKASPRPGNWRRSLAEMTENVTPTSTGNFLAGLTQWPIDLVPLREVIVERSRLQTQLLRDVFGNPFRPPPAIHSAWLAYDDGLAIRLAEAAYMHRHLPSGHLDQHRLAVLGDALEEGGCPQDHELLLHLRGPGPHVRGCWLVDLLLAKEPVPSPREPASGANGPRPDCAHGEEVPGLVRFCPSRVEGLPDVRDVIVYPDRLEVNTRGSWVTFRFSQIGRRQESRVVSLVKRLAGLFPLPALVADRDWFHPPRDRFFLWYTDPPLRTCMPLDEAADHASSYFSRIQAVLWSGGYATSDLG
jgi:hypothetical protein